MDPNEARKLIRTIQLEPKKWLFGLDPAIDKLTLAVFTLVPYMGEGEMGRGQAHAFLKDVPGVGKTALIRAFAMAVSAESAFCQGDPDKMPGDIVGREMYIRALGKFFGIEGPIFTHFFLADEINRNPPKTDAAFLGPMEERVVVRTETDIQNETMREIAHRLHPVPGAEDEYFFLVLATANPIEQEGTYPISEAVLDRFPLSFSLGYPSREEEKRIRSKNVLAKKIAPVTDLKTILEVAHLIAESVKLNDVASEYMQRIIENSRPYHEDRKTASAALREAVDRLIEEGGGISPRTNYHLFAAACIPAFTFFPPFFSIFYL